VVEFNSLLQLIDLLAECCIGRNAVAQNIIKQFWFKPSLVEEIAVSEKDYSDNIRSRCLKLLRTMELDRDSLKPLQVPSQNLTLDSLKVESRTSSELIKCYKNQGADGPVLPIRSQKRNVRYRDHFLKLTKSMRDYLDKTKGVMNVSEVDKN